MPKVESESEFPRLGACVRVEKKPSRNETIKDVVLSLARNEFRDVYLRLESSKTRHRFLLTSENLVVHKNFTSEGKATLRLCDSGFTLFLSNAPPKKLVVFLKSIASKLAGNDLNPIPKSRARLLASVAPDYITDISPVTLQDVKNFEKGDKLLKSCDTPKTGRKIGSSELTVGQRDVLRSVSSGTNLFFTGGAGTGKSFIIEKIIGSLPPESTFVTASTGVAAHQIRGVTLHSFAGIATHSPDDKEIAKLVETKKGSAWRRCKVLIIDEISMVDGRYFEALERVARLVKKNEKPFGGIQLILTGDFLQLPPVTKQGEKTFFCFEAPAWSKCIRKIITLKAVKRQTDSSFITILNYLRFGRCTDEMAKILSATSTKKINNENGICATRLCTHASDVDAINRYELNKLKTPSRVFKALDSNSGLRMNSIVVDAKIELKVGAQVMLLKNINVAQGLVNGARGIVLGFDAQSGDPLVKFKSGPERRIGFEKWSYFCSLTNSLQTRQQLPLKLAWAFSIHKSQGMTLDCVEVSLSKVFEVGQAYVALSRAKDLRSLRVLNFQPTCIKADPKVVRFYKNLEMTTPYAINRKF